MKNSLKQILEGVSLKKISPNEATEQILSILAIDHIDVDDWLGLKYGAWYHPTIELVNYTNENAPKSTTPILSDLIADCFKDMLNLNLSEGVDERTKIVQEWSKQ